MLDSPVQQIKDRLSITEVLSGYVQLKKAGVNSKALCPFHSEKTPSLIVSPSKQIWHCFGCGRGGDIFEFIKLVENVEFPEALRILADRAGIELRKPTAQEIKIDQDRNVLYQINELAAEYYVKVLWESPQASEALNYLRQRGLTDQTIKNWQLGYAPDDYHYLENFLAKSFDKKDIELAGLIIKKDLPAGRQATAEYFDRFRGRIMFPILDAKGRHVGFTGRILKPQDNVGKYVNSPETPVYSKSKIIYGYFAAKRSIIKEQKVIIVEGQMDVITSHQAGFANTVASSGTAFTLDQIMELGKHAKEFVFALDSDKAGTMATTALLNTAKQYSIIIKIAELGEYKDPDEAIKKGMHVWKDIIEKAPHFVEYFFHKALKEFSISEADGVQKIKDLLLPLINSVDSSILRSHYCRKLASALGVAEASVTAELQKLGKPEFKQLPKEEYRKKDRLEWLQERLLGLVIRLKDKAVLSQFEPSDFGAYANVYTSIYTSAQSPELKTAFDLLEFGVQTEIEAQGLDAKAELASAARELKRVLLKQQMEKVSAELKSAEQQKDQQTVRKLSEEYVGLSKKISQLQS